MNRSEPGDLGGGALGKPGLSRRERATLSAISDTLVPGTAMFPWSATESGAVDDILAELARPRALQMRVVLRLILFLLDFFAVLRHGRTLGRLDPARRERFVHAWAESRSYTRRSLFRVVSAIVFSHYYARPQVYAALGFQPEAILRLPLRGSDRQLGAKVVAS